MPYNSIPYQQYIRRKSPSLVTALKAQGYISRAVHPWYGSGFRRNAVYPLLEFDSYDFLENLNDLDYLRKYPTDLSIYQYIIKLFEEKNPAEKLFNFTVTMQNHSGYDLEGMDPTIFLTELENMPRVEQYLSLLKESDIALEYLIDYFSHVDEDTIILLYGDHQPPYLEDEFWDSMQVPFYESKTKYQVPFMLWANYDMEEKEIDAISLNYLSILLLETAGLDTTYYMDFLKELQKEIPVITSDGYIDNSRKLLQPR